MKPDGATPILKKVAIALIAFCIGAGITLLLSMIGQSAGILPRAEAGGGIRSALLDLGLTFGLSGLGGIIAAGVSLLIHPTVTLRVYHLLIGLFVLGIGILAIVGNKSWFTRYAFGPLAVIAAIYVLWTAVFGRRSDVEDL